MFQQGVMCKLSANRQIIYGQSSILESPKRTSCRGNLLHTLQLNTVFSVPELATQTLDSDGSSSNLNAFANDGMQMSVNQCDVYLPQNA